MGDCDAAHTGDILRCSCDSSEKTITDADRQKESNFDARA